MPKTIPDFHSNRLNFLEILSDQINANAGTIGFDAAKITEVASLLQPLIDK